MIPPPAPSTPEATSVTGRRPLATAEVVAGAGVLALVVAALLPDAHIDDGPVLCPFRRLTGLPCPGCGLTRSWVHLMHGDVGRAFAEHPFGPLLAGLVVVLAVLGVRRRRRGEPPVSMGSLVRHPITVVAIGAWLAFAAVRMALAW